MTRKYESIWDAEGAVDVEIGAMRVLVEVGKKHEVGSFHQLRGLGTIPGRE